MDESSIQLIGEVQAPIPAAPGHPVLMDDEYVRAMASQVYLLKWNLLADGGK